MLFLFINPEILLLGALTLWGTHWIFKSLNPLSKRSETNKQNKERFAEKMKTKTVGNRILPEFGTLLMLASPWYCLLCAHVVFLDEYESLLLPNITFPEDINVSFQGKTISMHTSRISMLKSNRLENCQILVA